MGTLNTYAAALVAEWYGGRTGTPLVLERRSDGATPVFVAGPEGATIAIAIAALWESDADSAAEAARAAMESRLEAGQTPGPYIIWAPPRAAIPAEEPQASDFVMRAQMAAGPIAPGGRNEIELPVQIQIAKTREEGGYASVAGGLGRFWTLITERVQGTFHVNSTQLRRASQSEASRNALFDRVGELSRGLSVGDAAEFDAAEAWTIQRLGYEPLGETGFAIAQAPPNIDPSDGTLMRRLVRKRLQAAGEALRDVDAAIKGVGLIAIYEYAEHQNVGSFVKSLSPALFADLGFIVAVVDGEVRPVFAPR